MVNLNIKTGDEIIIAHGEEGKYTRGIFIQYTLDYEYCMIKTDEGLKQISCSCAYPLSLAHLPIDRKSKL